MIIPTAEIVKNPGLKEGQTNFPQLINHAIVCASAVTSINFVKSVPSVRYLHMVVN